ncbi:MAG: DUF262 domain-containing protein [Chloroflexi bacterium]|nr:DUF262 domain-containing protein [Chloroflexota bacterium]
MIATQAKLLTFLQKSPQFIVPIYQRTYSWTEKECRQLWDDILRAGSTDAIALHFVGSIVYVEQSLANITHQSPLLVIDGQQRLTTLTLLLEALARAAGDQEPVEGFSAAKLRHYYLCNSLESGDRYYKLLLSQTDNASLRAIVKNAEQPQEPSIRVIQNFALFTDWLESQRGDLAPVCRGLAKLVIVDVALTRDQDNPQLIFESMNSTGKELSQADLIRNFVLMGLEPDLQTLLYEQYWRPMEQDFGQEAYSTQFDSFMRHYLTVRTGEIPREREVYDAFKDYSRTAPVEEAGIEALVKEIRAFARYFCAFALGREQNAVLGRAFHDLRELKVDVAYPFLLELYHDYEDGTLSTADLETAVRLVESYVFRRAICGLPTNSMNKTFATFGKALKKDRYLESIQAHFLTLPSYRRFPTGDDFSRELQTKDLYNFRSRSYWLRRLENHDRKEPAPVEDYTIEHVLPQNPALTVPWQQTLGADWKRIQDTWLHTLGNLTLTAYNSSYSDRPFAEKRDMPDAPEKGLRRSPLWLNLDFSQSESWNEESIRERATRLANQALVVWPLPRLAPAVLASYRPPNVASPGRYSMADHPNLFGAMRDLFVAFREEVLALDPCVSEEFLKLYVAYKAETNFVDVVPQAKRLLLTINMAFSEIDDPKGLCRDVSGMGRWGNGDVEVGIQALDELPYVMGLVRQSFKRQMGDGGPA